ncbi:FUSC family protein [Sulfurovum riftiae]|uniref:Fusaric acid resistance protein n=1 Tax=Sulfurovum riftiae TaxID=1630136 RepID=A0A151CJK4_9BACT|nr:FUSC family protein [Sulfurovum riftiae]KYJ87679.1 hypothetical protein AS592_11340 [Sulfurovum riftiae]
MKTKAATQKRSLIESILAWTLPQPSEKMKFAIKASLSLVIVYAISFSQGWDNTTTAATTIMLIAAIGSVGDSVMKGMLRVIGTVIGAVIGMVLIGLFPQDRMLYLALLSILVTISLYFARAYKGDMTIFMLTAITMMLMFKNGEVDGVFLYGVDKTFMTIFGIAVYTLVGVLLWPVSLKDESTDDAKALTQKQQALFKICLEDKESNKAAEQEMMAQTQKLTQSAVRASSIENGFNRSQWASVLRDYRRIGNILTLLSYQKTSDFPKALSHYISNYPKLEREIEDLFSAVAKAWDGGEAIVIPETFEARFNENEILSLSQLQRATLSSIVSEMNKLHALLRKVAYKLNALNSPKPTRFEEEPEAKSSRFTWLDPEHLKGSLITFLVFWTAVFLWITVNPPGGFYIVALATGLSIITTFSPVKPSLLMIVFTLSFIFATAMYVLVLPNLYYGWELGLFLFIYGFIGFYFINPKIAIFFLLGIATFNINNQMYYAFDGFLLTLFVFYAFLSLLLFFYYIPFSTKPEHLFLVMKKRFFGFARELVQYNWDRVNGRLSLLQKFRGWYAKTHLLNTVQNMQLWSSQIDGKYFSEIEKEKLIQFTKECDIFANLLLIMYNEGRKRKENPLIKAYISQADKAPLSSLMRYYQEGHSAQEAEAEWKDTDSVIQHIEKNLTDFFESQDVPSYPVNEVLGFYESISMHKNSWRAFFSCQKLMRQIDFNVLKESRF